MEILKAEHLSKIYGSGGGKVHALRDVSLAVREGEFVAIVGSSGSGKTTLLNLLGGLDKPTAGRVVVQGHDLAALSDEQLTIFRRRSIGFVFQHFNLIPMLNVRENILFPLEADGRKPDEVFLSEIIGVLGLSDKLCAMPHQLSGGQQQRVAIARALSTKPALILADEPTGNLDSKAGLEVALLLKRSVNAFGQTLLMITHNEFLAQMADRVLRIEDGQIVTREAAHV